MVARISTKPKFGKILEKQDRRLATGRSNGISSDGTAVAGKQMGASRRTVGGEGVSLPEELALENWGISISDEELRMLFGARTSDKESLRMMRRTVLWELTGGANKVRSFSSTNPALITSIDEVKGSAWDEEGV